MRILVPEFSGDIRPFYIPTGWLFRGSRKKKLHRRTMTNFFPFQPAPSYFQRPVLFRRGLVVSRAFCSPPPAGQADPQLYSADTVSLLSYTNRVVPEWLCIVLNLPARTSVKARSMAVHASVVIATTKLSCVLLVIRVVLDVRVMNIVVFVLN